MARRRESSRKPEYLKVGALPERLADVMVTVRRRLVRPLPHRSDLAASRRPAGGRPAAPPSGSRSELRTSGPGRLIVRAPGTMVRSLGGGRRSVAAGERLGLLMA